MFSKAISGFRQAGSLMRTKLQDLLEIRRERQAIANLTPRQLSDIGIRPAQTGYAATRSIWDARAIWRG
ncbi:DUF1127 domain-containing protein [Celeribacter arenosi]|uniref:YjiS-like domain-containing protein n=1 Tax=Celeribacter arenosi TaxID=792649 RepID=A0ABP7K7F1_9RHOB